MLNVSSSGVFLALGFLFGIFLIWRLTRAWDLDEEKTLDLTLLTFVFGLLGARMYFAIEHLQYFLVHPVNLVLITKTPGFNFWGGFLGGWLALYFFAGRFRMDFWQLADIASVGLIGGLIWSDIGCFLGGCNMGVAGTIGKRWQYQIIEALLLSFGLLRIWAQATHFHQRGKIVSLGFIYIGIIGLLLLPLKQDRSGLIFSLVLTLLGLSIFYKITGQNPISQLKKLSHFMVQFTTSPAVRRKTLQSLGKSWYNQKVSICWRLRNLKKHLRRSDVKFS